MAESIGGTPSGRILGGLVERNAISGDLRSFPAQRPDMPVSIFPEEAEAGLIELHTEALVETICEQVIAVSGGAKDIDAVGVALPGFIRHGVVEDAPNLPQLKGARVGELLSAHLKQNGVDAPVTILNDADAVAVGLASLHGKLDSVVRVWTLGIGIGFGQYPFSEGSWENGHSVVSLDEKERFCGCGGVGHMEGIMGHRAMRLRFLDMEPEEVFAAAREGDPRCVEFKKLWHRALAAATASSIYASGAGRFFLTGFNVRFVDLPMLKDLVGQMVKMSPLQGYSFEVVGDEAHSRVIGAGVAAEHAAGRR